MTEAIDSGVGGMDSVHFQIETFSINSVFRSRVEMELDSSESSTGSVNIFSNMGFKSLGVLSSFVNSNLGSVVVFP